MSVGEGEVDMVEADGVESIPFAFHEEDCSGCGCCADDDSWIKDVYTLGTIFMPFATFEIDPTPPANILAWRFASFYDHENPSRLEYFWAKAGQLNGKGPPVSERSVDYQEYRLYVETGTKIVTAFTDLGLRSVDPELNANTTSYSDMSAGVKTLLLNRDRLKLSHIFTTYIPSGRAARGFGTGHTSLEPGFLGNYRWGPKTSLHGELKYWFPIAADPDLKGELLQYGLGISHVWREGPCERWALIPTLEFNAWTILDGKEIRFSDLAIVDFDPAFILNIQPGIRLAFHEKWDLGISGSFAVTRLKWYDSLLRFELRKFF